MKTMHPKLRFCEFTNEWYETVLENEVDFLDNLRKPIKDEDRNKIKGVYPYYGASGIIDYVNDYLFDDELILLGEDGANIILRNSRLAFLVSGKCWINNHAHVLKNKNHNNRFFICECLERQKFDNYNTGTAQPKLNQDVCKKIKFYTTDIEEQTKIATFLNLYYKKIELQKKKIEQLEKLSFDALFTHKYDGKTYKLEQILTEVNERTTQNNQYEVLSSTKAGLFYQKDYFNKEIASEDNTGYKILKLNQVVISPQNLWLGNINYNDSIKIGIVSPSYKIFNIKEGFNKTFISHLLKSKRSMYDYMISSEQGASVVRRNLNIELFNEIIFTIPDIETQNHIAHQLVLINNKINLEKQKLEVIEKYKRGLLQQLFI